MDLDDEVYKLVEGKPGASFDEIFGTQGHTANGWLEGIHILSRLRKSGRIEYRSGWRVVGGDS